MSDAIIFLSAVDYFYYDFDEYYINNTIFISNNTSDFGDKTNNKILHPELEKMLIEKPIIFNTNLAESLDLSNDIIRRYQEYLDYLNRDCTYCHQSCKGEEYGMGEVLFDQEIEVELEDESYGFNPNQLLISFGEELSYEHKDLQNLPERDNPTVFLGSCDFCGSEHLRCVCEEILISINDKFECCCGKVYKFINGELIVIKK